MGFTFVTKIYLNSQVALIDDQISNDKKILKSSDNEALRKQVEGLNNQVGAINNLQSGHYYWSRALVELSNILPPEISLDLIKIDRDTSKIEISGTAKTRDSVLQLWSNVIKSSYFKNVNFPLDNLEKATDDPFSFTFYVNVDKLKDQ